MHINSLDSWQHHHAFTAIHEHGARRTTQVLLLTLVTMVFEIICKPKMQECPILTAIPL